MTTATVQGNDAGQDPSVGRVTAWTLLVGGLVGAAASAMLLIDRITMLKDQASGTSSRFICDISSQISCTSVMQSKQAEVFGFPSPILGLPAFAALATVGALLVLGVQLPRIAWIGLQVGSILGILFVVWLQIQSIWVLRELCPWCMAVWAATIPVFVLVTAHVTRAKLLRNWAGLVIALWYLVVVAAIVFQFYV